MQEMLNHMNQLSGAAENVTGWYSLRELAMASKRSLMDTRLLMHQCVTAGVAEKAVKRVAKEGTVRKETMYRKASIGEPSKGG